MTPPFQIRIKNSHVRLNLHPALAKATVIVCRIIWETTGQIPVITSGWDQRHAEISLHYIGCAVDLRSNPYSDEEKRIILERACETIGEAFDLILEAPGQDREHFHLEYDAGKRDRFNAAVAALGGTDPILNGEEDGERGEE